MGWLALSLALVVVYWTTSIPAYSSAKNRNSFYVTDVLAPVAQAGVWASLGLLGWGERPGMSNLIEIPIILFISFIFLQVSVFAGGKNRFRNRVESLVLLAISIVVAILVRSLMPYIPDF